LQAYDIMGTVTRKLNHTDITANNIALTEANRRLTHMENHGSKQLGPALLAACFTLISCLTYSLTFKMQGTCSSEMLVDFRQTTWCYISEERTLQAGPDIFPLINILIMHVQVCYNTVTLQICVCCFFLLMVLNGLQ
jgi:hypothetical protein